jgi:hypothetical protein
MTDGLHAILITYPAILVSTERLPCHFDGFIHVVFCCPWNPSDDLCRRGISQFMGFRRMAFRPFPFQKKTAALNLYGQP